MTAIQLDTCSSTGGASKTWVLTARRNLPLPAYYEALGMLQRNGVCMYTVRRVTIQQHKAQPSWRRKWASIMRTMRSETFKLQNL